MAYEVLDYRVARLVSTPAGSEGVCAAAMAPVSPTEIWRIEQITVQSDSTTSTQCLIYDREPLGNLVPIQATRVGNLTVDDQSTPITLLANDQLTIVWETASPLSVGRARVQYTVLDGRTAGRPMPVSA